MLHCVITKINHIVEGIKKDSLMKKYYNYKFQWQEKFLENLNRGFPNCTLQKKLINFLSANKGIGVRTF